MTMCRFFRWLCSPRQSSGESAERRIAEFKRNGSIPWTPGYEEYKWQAIERALEQGRFDSLVGVSGYGYRIDERVVELPWLVDRLPAGPGILLDAGAALNHLPLILHPRLAEKRILVSTLAPERNNFAERGISYVFEDFRQTCFREDFFDWIACISTLEHVGLDNTFLYTDNPARQEADTQGYLTGIHVFRSLLKPGGRLFLSMPFGLQKNHGWFQVFDASMLDRIKDHFEPSAVNETIFMYSNDGWRIASRDEAADAICYDVHAGPSHAPDHCAFSRAVACMELTR